ncbi:fasciclin domain-containing protein [soil metagenome]
MSLARFTSSALTCAALACLALAPAAASAQDAPAPAAAATSKTMGGTAMLSTKTIAENVVVSKDHTQLVTMLKAADLVDTLNGPGPFTVFAPTNSGVDQLPRGELPSLLKPENKRRLTSLLTYHVVKGALTAKDLEDQVKKGGGQAALETLHGAYITVRQSGRSLVLTDLNGERSRITIADVPASNGVVHVVDRVLTP